MRVAIVAGAKDPAPGIAERGDMRHLSVACPPAGHGDQCGGVIAIPCRNATLRVRRRWRARAPLCAELNVAALPAQGAPGRRAAQFPRLYNSHAALRTLVCSSCAQLACFCFEKAGGRAAGARQAQSFMHCRVADHRPRLQRSGSRAPRGVCQCGVRCPARRSRRPAHILIILKSLSAAARARGEWPGQVRRDGGVR